MSFDISPALSEKITAGEIAFFQHKIFPYQDRIEVLEQITQLQAPTRRLNIWGIRAEHSATDIRYYLPANFANLSIAFQSHFEVPQLNTSRMLAIVIIVDSAQVLKSLPHLKLLADNYRQHRSQLDKFETRILIKPDAFNPMIRKMILPQIAEHTGGNFTVIDNAVDALKMES